MLRRQSRPRLSLRYPALSQLAVKEPLEKPQITAQARGSSPPLGESGTDPSAPSLGLDQPWPEQAFGE